MHADPSSEGKYHGKTRDANLDFMKSEYLDLFDGYFSGNLDEREQLDLESRLKTDVTFEEAFQEYRDLRNGIDYSIMNTLKEELQALESTLPEVKLEKGTEREAKEVSMTDRFGWWKVAAVVVVIAVSTVVVIQLNQQISNQDLFSQHFEPYPNEFVSAKRGDDIAANPLVQSFQAYDNEDYIAAIDGFTKILAEEEDVMVLFYLGSAQLAQNQTQAAIATFERFLEISKDSVTDARWYLALSYLHEDRVEEAKELMEALSEDGKYGKDASKILRKLN